MDLGDPVFKLFLVPEILFFKFMRSDTFMTRDLLRFDDEPEPQDT